MKSYHEEAREFVDKLLDIQRTIRKKYPEHRSPGVAKAITEAMKGFDIYNTRTDAGMLGYWNRYRCAIRFLIPGNQYSGYQKLQEEFETLEWKGVGIRKEECNGENGKIKKESAPSF